MRRLMSGPMPWHLLSLLFGTPVFALGYLLWAAACLRLAFRGRLVGFLLMALPLVLVAFDGLGVIATLWTVRRKVWTFGAPRMAVPVTTWSAMGWSVIAAGQGLFLGLAAIPLWLLAPPHVDEG